MRTIRHLARRHADFAAALIALALLVRLVIPEGFMPSGDARLLMLCPGQTAMAPMPGMEHGKHSSDAPKTCAFSALAVPAIGAAGIALILAAFAYVVLRALLAPAAILASPPKRWRPPLRAPPIAA